MLFGCTLSILFLVTCANQYAYVASRVPLRLKLKLFYQAFRKLAKFIMIYDFSKYFTMLSPKYLSKNVQNLKLRLALYLKLQVFKEEPAVR